jgi:uncharacterized protein
MPSPVVHFEIGCRDGAKAQAFYGKLFGWEFDVHGPARMIRTGMKEGIQGHLNSLGHEPHNYTVVYVQVADIEATLASAQKLGAKTLVPKMEVPGMGHFAWLADPEGTMVGLWTPAMK